MTQIDYYLSTISPYTYLAGTRLEELAARCGASITYKPLDPMALFDRTGGQRLPDRHQSRKDYRVQELRRQSAKHGLALNLQPQFFPANPAPSSYALIAAAGQKGGDLGALAHAFCRACWAEERNVADDGTVKEILAANGFDPDLAERGMLAAAETYAANLEEAAERGVFGVPFYIVGEEKFWGQDRLEDLEAYLAGAA